jgi:LacI family repressor for deo operon, udp, cdd, tsx, nupC, and nupG
VEQYPYGQGERAMELMIKILSEKTDNKITNTSFYVEEMPATLVAYQQATIGG